MDKHTMASKQWPGRRRGRRAAARRAEDRRTYRGRLDLEHVGQDGAAGRGGAGLGGGACQAMIAGPAISLVTPKRWRDRRWQQDERAIAILHQEVTSSTDKMMLERGADVYRWSPLRAT